MTGDHKTFEKAARKILSVFTDGAITNHDLAYVAFYTVVNSYPADPVLNRISEFMEHVEYERIRIKENNQYVQDGLF
tara:strand:+ start:50 stop:280 length:231 start_codon:yes stop_codon:yes gene_type:complete